jgi:predicted Zn-dependent protease with MMP-like domain
MRNELVSENDRIRFDELLEELIPTLPPRVKEVMEEVPIIVEDEPNERTMKEMRLKHPANLLGLYRGNPIDRRSVQMGYRLGDRIYLFRLGLLTKSRSREGTVSRSRLREEIRKTILHEIGHYHGMDEAELEDLGY